MHNELYIPCQFQVVFQRFFKNSSYPANSDGTHTYRVFGNDEINWVLNKAVEICLLKFTLLDELITNQK